MTLLVLLGTATVLAFILVYSATYSRQIILQDAETNASSLVILVSNQLDSELAGTANIAQNLAYAVQYGQWDKTSLTELLRDVVSSNPNVYGATIAFEPFAFRSDLKGYAPYYCKGENGLKFVQLGSGSYDYVNKEWYRVPAEQKKSMWSLPYFDEGGGNTLMLTYSCPFFFVTDGEIVGSKLKGIVTVDISINSLEKMLSTLKLKNTGFAFLVESDGTIIAHSDNKPVMPKSLFQFCQ